MRLIQNTSLQGFNLPFNTPNGIFELYLFPRKSIIVPDTYTSKVVDTLIRRRMVKVTKIEVSNLPEKTKYNK